MNSWVYVRVQPDRAAAGFWPEGSEPLWLPVGVAVGGELGVPLGAAEGVPVGVPLAVAVGELDGFGCPGRQWASLRAGWAGLPCAIARLMIAGALWLCPVPASPAGPSFAIAPAA